MTKNNNKILIVGVLMLGAYMTMRRSMAQMQQVPQQYRAGLPNTMPASVGSGLAQAGVGAVSSWLQNLIGGVSQASAEDNFRNEIMRSPYLIANEVGQNVGVQDLATPTGLPEFVGDILNGDTWLA